MGRGTVYNNIVTKELLDKVNQENIDLVEEWEEYLYSIDRSPKTISQYLNDMNIFMCWFLQNADNKFFIEINKRDVMRYQNYLLNKLNLSSSRIRRMKSTLSSLSNYIESMLDDVYPDFRNIINKIPAPTLEPVREKTILTEDQVDKLLKYLVDNKKYQKACVFALALYSGARKTELLRFKVDYFKDEYIQHGLYKTPEKIKTKGRGKSGKMLNKYTIAKYFEPYLLLWLDYRKENKIDGEWLFVTKNNGEYVQMQVSTLDSWARTFGRILDLDFYWHSNRHFYCTMLYQAGIPAEVIKEISGWASVEMVSLYNDTEVDDELGKYFGSEGIIKQDEKSTSDL